MKQVKKEIMIWTSKTLRWIKLNSYQEALLILRPLTSAGCTRLSFGIWHDRQKMLDKEWLDKISDMFLGCQVKWDSVNAFVVRIKSENDSFVFCRIF